MKGPRPVKDGTPISRAADRAILVAAEAMKAAGFTRYAVSVSMVDPVNDDVLTQSEIHGPPGLALAIQQSIMGAVENADDQ